jgi:hypothetical protein
VIVEPDRPTAIGDRRGGSLAMSTTITMLASEHTDPASVSGTRSRSESTGTRSRTHPGGVAVPCRRGVGHPPSPPRAADLRTGWVRGRRRARKGLLHHILGFAAIPDDQAEGAVQSGVLRMDEVLEVDQGRLGALFLEGGFKSVGVRVPE